MKNASKKIQKAQKLITDSLRFHGLLTPMDESQSVPEITLPEHLKEPDFLFKNLTKKNDYPKVRMAAFKNNKKKRDK